MSLITFGLGIMLMIGTYIAISIIGTMLLSYLVNAILHMFVGMVSIKAKLNQQQQSFYHKQGNIERTYQRKQRVIQQRLFKRQQILDARNTRRQIKYLSEKTCQQLKTQRASMTPDTYRLIRKAVKRCSNQLDLHGLISINHELSTPLHSPSRIAASKSTLH